MPNTTRHAVLDKDRRQQDKGPQARTHERLDDDIAEQGHRGQRDMPFDDEDDDDHLSER